MVATTVLGMGLPGSWELAVVGLLMVVPVIQAWMLVDCAIHEPNESPTKVYWILAIFFFNIIGGVAYYFVKKRPRDRLTREWRVASQINRPSETVGRP